MGTNQRRDIYIRIIVAVIILVIGYLVFHFASWKFLWNYQLSFLDIWGIQYTHGTINDAFLVTRDAFAIRINEGYYGVVNNGRFLSSPVLSWILLVISIGFVPLALKVLFGIDD